MSDVKIMARPLDTNESTRAPARVIAAYLWTRKRVLATAPVAGATSPYTVPAGTGLAFYKTSSAERGGSGDRVK